MTEKYKFKFNCDEKKLVDFLYNSCDIELKPIMRELTYNVPYRLISPFFSDELPGMKDSLD